MRLLGAAIKTERLVKHMTRRQLASRAGISLRLLTDLERGFLSDLRLAAFFNIAMALGVTQQVPIDDRHSVTKEWVLTRLAIMFGGRAAEELILSQLSTGAGDDIERATELARKMVCEWGMSEKLGPMTFGKKEEEIFLGRDFTQRVDYSESTALQIDGEVRRIILEAYERAKMLLRRNLAVLHKMAESLLERESLDGSDIDTIVRQVGAENAAAASA